MTLEVGRTHENTDKMGICLTAVLLLRWLLLFIHRGEAHGMCIQGTIRAHILVLETITHVYREVPDDYAIESAEALLSEGRSNRIEISSSTQ